MNTSLRQASRSIRDFMRLPPFVRRATKPTVFVLCGLLVYSLVTFHPVFGASKTIPVPNVPADGPSSVATFHPSLLSVLQTSGIGGGESSFKHMNRVDPVVTLHATAADLHLTEREGITPGGSRLSGREESIWEGYEWFLIGCLLVFLAQSILTAALLFQRRRRRLAEQSLERQLRFEMLLADISARFVDLPFECIDSAIEDAQRRVCECLDLDMSVMWQWVGKAPDYLVLTQLYRPLGGPPVPDRMDSREYVPWCLKEIMQGRTLVVSSMEDFPAEAALDRQTYDHYGIKSSLSFPLSASGESILGVLSFLRVRGEHSWPEALIKRLRLVSELYAGALARKRAEQELRESESRLSLVTASAELGLWVLESDTGIIWTSEKARELFSFASEEEISFERFLQRVSPQDRDRIRDAVQQAYLTKEDFHLEYRILLPNGTQRWIMSDGRAYFSPSGEPERLMGVSADISRRMKVEEELRHRMEELSRLTRIATAGELATCIAHEIKQPLTAILCNAQAAQQFLAKPLPDLDEIRQILDDIVQEDTRAGDVIKKVRALFNKEEANFERVNLQDAILESIQMIRTGPRLNGMPLVTEFAPGVPGVWADRVQLEQVIINMVLNAADAMKNVHPSSRKLFVQTALQDSRTVRVSVIDSGAGIAEAALGRLFEPFYTTKAEGMGIGLSLSRNIVRAHGGVIGAENNPEGGATFYFTLLAADGDPP